MYCLGCHTTHTLVYFSLNGVKVTIYFGYNLSDILPYKKFICVLKEENHIILQNLQIDLEFQFLVHIHKPLAMGGSG